MFHTRVVTLETIYCYCNNSCTLCTTSFGSEMFCRYQGVKIGIGIRLYDLLQGIMKVYIFYFINPQSVLQKACSIFCKICKINISQICKKYSQKLQKQLYHQLISISVYLQATSAIQAVFFLLLITQNKIKNANLIELLFLIFTKFCGI